MAELTAGLSAHIDLVSLCNDNFQLHGVLRNQAPLPPPFVMAGSH